MKLPRFARSGFITAVSTLFLSMTAMAQTSSPVLSASAGTPPAAKRVPKEMVNHGDKRVDDYFWLREKDDPETLPYLRKENEYMEAMLQPLQPLREQIYNELKSREIESDASVPERWGEYEYYTRMEPGKQYPIYCRKKAVDGAVEQVLLDQNQLAEGQS